MDQAHAPPSGSDGKPLLWDALFLALLVTCLVGSAYVGVLAYREGVKTETTKRNGEAWLEWFTEHAARRAEPDFAPEVCAAKPGATWGPCQEWLLGSEGPFHTQRNAYADEPTRITGTCGGADRTVAGLVALERVTPLPPGAAIPFTVGPLTPQEAIEQKLTIRISVCNTDASAIRVGEVDF